MDECVGAVWGVGGAEVGGPGTHLVFEGGEAADVVDAALLVEGGDGFGPDVLALSRPHALDGKGAFDCVLDGGLGHLASGVVLDDDHGCAKLVVEVDDAQGPAIRGETGGLVCEDVCVLSAHVGPDDDDAGL